MRELQINLKNKYRQSGQALLELILVVGILSLILVAIASLTVLSLSTIQKSRLRSRATTITQQGQENIRAHRDKSNWTEFVSQCVGSIQTWADWTSIDMSGGNYTPTTNCDTTDPSLVIISTRVDWTFGGQSYNVVLETSLSKPSKAIYR